MDPFFDDVDIFLNFRVENSGALAWIGDKCLAPFRYITCHGKTVRIQRPDTKEEIEIHCVPSFHKRAIVYSTSGINQMYQPTPMIKIALLIMTLIPTVVGAAIKGLAYLSPRVKENHRLIKEFFTPINRTIGSFSNPIETEDQLKEALEVENKNALINRPTRSVTIYVRNIPKNIINIYEDLIEQRFKPRNLYLLQHQQFTIIWGEQNT